ncbi:609_t:CDS:2, partial [Racocetra persica]
MASKSDKSHLILIEDKNKTILEIICSPNLKHVATLDEDSNISLWSIDSERLFAISDNKYVSIGLNRDKPYNFKTFDFETEKEVSLKFPDWQREIDFLSFIDNGNIIMINTEYYRAYFFSNKENIRWACKSMIELKYFKKIYITPKGKLIIFNDTIYEITMWDIEKLWCETHILIDWNHTLEFVEISDDEKLLLTCAKNWKTKET